MSNIARLPLRFASSRVLVASDWWILTGCPTCDFWGLLIGATFFGKETSKNSNSRFFILLHPLVGRAPGCKRSAGRRVGFQQTQEPSRLSLPSPSQPEGPDAQIDGHRSRGRSADHRRRRSLRFAVYLGPVLRATGNFFWTSIQSLSNASPRREQPRRSQGRRAVAAAVS